MKIRNMFYSLLLILAFLVLTGSFCISSTLYAAPNLCFTDITSGPASGLNDGRGSGAIVTVWGNDLGTSQGSNKVYFTDSASIKREAAYVYYWCSANGSNGGPANLTKLGLQEIAFSIPSGSATGLGTISVIVNGATSNTLPFTVRTGNVRYLDRSASSSGSGTYSSPWRLMSDARAGWAAGDIIYVRSGIYSEAIDPANSNTFYPGVNCANGTQNNPIAIVAYPGQNPEFIAMNGATPSVGAMNNTFKVYSGASANYFTFSKLYCKAYNENFLMWTEGFRLIGSKCSGPWMVGQGGMAGNINTGGASAYIYGNECLENMSANHYNHVIYTAGCPTYGSDIGWNYLHDNHDDYGPWIEWNSEGTRCSSGQYVGTHNYLHHNYIDMTGESTRAVSVYSLSYTIGDAMEPAVYIYDNIFIGGAGASDRPVINHDDGHIYVFNNTFYNSGQNGTGGYCFMSYSNFYPAMVNLTATVKNNIFYGVAGLQGYLSFSGTGWSISNAHVTIDKNIYYGKGNGPTQDVHAINADPLMASPSTGNFTLQSSSPARAAGENLSTIFTKDFRGYTRSSWDIGAFEYSADTSPDSTPPTAPTGVNTTIIN